MKINWGLGIAIVYTAFAGMIVFMVVKAHQNKMDLVTENYYEKELDFEAKQKKTLNASHLSSSITLLQEDQNLVISLPNEFIARQWKGELILYCPSNAKNDRTIALSGNGNSYKYSLQANIKGYYKVELEMELDGQQFYTTKSFVF